MNSALLIGLIFLGQVARETDAPIPAREAPLRMTVPEGFKVTLFAGEPDVKQPIAFCFDDRGRLWVCECYSYPKWHQDPREGKDRILIFEDTDGDGRFDKRTVFAENLSNLSGIEYGFGGVWLCSLPNLIYIPIKEGEDRPAGPAQIKLDGWDLKNSGHNAFNSLKWGPDGWLYGCNGIQSRAQVGPPGCPDKERIPMNCGVWRYHPTKKKFEPYAHGTTNPWGLDWDEHGEMFITNCVTPHLYHVVPGAHFERMYGQDLNPHVYGLMKTCADHLHWGGGSWTESRAPSNAGEPGSVRTRSNAYQVHSEAGGGHAHVGCMIYLGDNWPERYRNGVFMCNLHGNRINHDILERNGSTYVARHGKDFLFANDPWFRGLALTYGPDGGVYVIDWTDTGECHNHQAVDRSNGRIYKITYDPKASGGRKPPVKIDLAKLNDEELVELQHHTNEWYVRHARRLMQERSSSGKLKGQIRVRLLEKLDKGFGWQFYPNSRAPLRDLWAANAVEAMSECWVKFLSFPDPYVRNWVVRLYRNELNEGRTKLSKKDRDSLISIAIKEPSPQVRLAYASLLQRLPPEDQFFLAWVLVKAHNDSQDPYLPWMLWYGIEPFTQLSEADLPPLKEFFRPGEGRIVQLRGFLLESSIPIVRECITRRLVSQRDEVIDFLLQGLTEKYSSFVHRDVLRGMLEALKGRRSLPMPSAWDLVYPKLIESPLGEVRELTLALAVQFGDERALTTLRKILVDDKSPQRLRQDALQTLLQKQLADLVSVLQKLLDDPAVRGPVLRGLSAYGDPKTPGLILQRYGQLTDEEKGDAVQTLCSRAPYALALLDAVEKKQVGREELGSATVRQLRALNDKRVTEKINQVWGALRPASEEKVKLMAKYKQVLTPAYLQAANKSNGRALFAKNCAVCHHLFDDGGKIGPDLTGSQRTNLDYILENILDPSAIVPREFQVAVITTSAGRTLTGLIKQESKQAITVQTQNEQIILPREEIESLNQTRQSMMPDGLFDNLRIEEVRDLIGYLASPVQVPLKK